MENWWHDSTKQWGISIKTELTCFWSDLDIYNTVIGNDGITNMEVMLPSFCTFGDESVLSRASQCAVDLTDQLHVVQEGVESVEVREADQVRSAATCSLAEDKQMM